MPTSPSPGQPSGLSVPAATLGLQAARRAHALHGKDLPRLHEMRARLLEDTQAWCGAALTLTLRAHAGAASALRFDLLVAPGLRAGPSRHDEESFRRQVEDVSTCTEVTWLHVREALVQDTSGDSMEPAAMDFVMGSRAIQREVAQAAGSIAQLREALEAGSGGPGSLVVLERLAESGRLLQPLVLACEAARAVQMAAWRQADAQRATQASLRELARVMRGGLLVRLGALLAPGSLPGAGDLADAGQARDALVARLHDGVRCVEALRAAQDELLSALEAMPPG